ncbi:Zinc finger, DHHC-type, palmitoyltransferase [Parasponia andersonii]|uniref:S-acyltransferase n=1 Tax=Parasponia andersonii TaxID=3476 RepID=A0A2P5C7I8_PARAD|nr:Zinc finger, DHHC-type, palmitoyltransferase [Parasponia andersonii]
MYPNQLPSDSNRHIIDTHGHDPSLRVYQLWKGSNIFFLKGRLIFGPDVRSLFLTVFLIVTPVILFSAFLSQTLILHFHHGTLVVAISVFLTIYVIILLFLTSGRDPGIVPRNQHPPEAQVGEGYYDSTVYSSDWGAESHNRPPSLPPTKDVMVNGSVVKVKYCQTCMLYRPPRCSHCSICNNCVDRFDHHCPWVGQCIGKRNYRFFFMFISSTTLLCLYVFGFCWVNIRQIMGVYHCNVWRALIKSPVSGILILYTFIAAWFVGGLTVFHLYLICTNQTTYESFRYRYEGKTNPYNRGCACNFVEIFLSKIPKSRNKFREKVKGEDSSCAFNSWTSLGLNKTRTEMEMETGKRKAVGAEDLEDIRSQMESVGGLERCGMEARHRNWEITPDIQMLAAEFGMEYGSTDREKIHGKL